MKKIILLLISFLSMPFLYSSAAISESAFTKNWADAEEFIPIRSQKDILKDRLQVLKTRQDTILAKLQFLNNVFDNTILIDDVIPKLVKQESDLKQQYLTTRATIHEIQTALKSSLSSTAMEYRPEILI